MTTVLSLLATWGQTRKKVESWWLWIVADVVYIPLYQYKGLTLTALLYLGFLALCVVGLTSWTRDLRARLPQPALNRHERPAHGLVIGKFYPPHAGHHHLIETAARHCRRLSVVVMAAGQETIPWRTGSGGCARPTRTSRGWR